jgi:hypothetical protein
VGITVTHIGSTPITIDSLRAVRDPSGGDSIAVASLGEVVVGTLLAAERIEAGGFDVTAELQGGGYAVTPAESLIVRFATREDVNGAWTLVLDGTVADGEPVKVRVLELDGSGGWVARGVTFAGGRGPGVVENLRSDSLCLVTAGETELRAVSRLVAVANRPAAEPIAIENVEHSRTGAVDPEAGMTGVTLEPGDVLDLRTQTAESAPRFVLFRTSAGTASTTRLQRVGTASLPTSFALAQNEPNPFGAGTQIRFAVPTRSHVKIEVFDVRGRRVRTLCDETWAAGNHAVSWDARDSAGRRSGPGVYVYRMNAGGFQASRKLVVLP